jgi:hypothetical protein
VSSVEKLTHEAQQTVTNISPDSTDEKIRNFGAEKGRESTSPQNERAARNSPDSIPGYTS